MTPGQPCLPSLAHVAAAVLPAAVRVDLLLKMALAAPVLKAVPADRAALVAEAGAECKDLHPNR